MRNEKLEMRKWKRKERQSRQGTGSDSVHSKGIIYHCEGSLILAMSRIATINSPKFYVEKADWAIPINSDSYTPRKSHN